MAFALDGVGHPIANSERAWTIALGAFVIIAIALGGTSEPTPIPALTLRVLSIVLIAIGLIRLGFAPPSRSAAEVFLIIILAVALLLFQLLPLPPALWSALPGRQFVIDGLRAAGVEPAWMAFSLSPPATRIAFLAILPPIAAFTAALSLKTADRWLVTTVLLVCVLLSILLGLAQKFQGSKGFLSFYSETGWATGPFANRNFFAALLYCSIPLTWALALRVIRDRHVNKYIVGAFAAVMLLAVILGLAAAGSRAGIILAMVALLASATLGLGSARLEHRRVQSRWAIIAAIAAMVLIGQFGMVAILRLAELDPVSDYRTLISDTTVRAAWEYFPFGSGFGTFVPVYAMHETPATILSAYVNHAHNDWLELWMEGGIPAALIMLAFIGWYLASLYRLWRPAAKPEGLLLGRAGAITCGLLLLHSIVDYPLREPSLLVIFGLMCAFVAIMPADHHAVERYHRSSQPRASHRRTSREGASR